MTGNTITVTTGGAISIRLGGAKGEKGDTGDPGSSALIWRETWSDANTYTANDYVFNPADEKIYICILGHAPSHEPPNSTYWLEFQGPQGADGKSLLNGASAPTTQGNNGDFYIETTNSRLYGPKSSSVWPGTYVSLIGPTGATGATGAAGSNGTNGADGTDGTDGTQIYSTTGVPSDAIGVDGDWAIDYTASNLYGPKAAGAWGAAASFKGIQGDPGTMAWKGAWVTATLYYRNNLATHAKTGYGLCTYIALSDHTSGADADEPEIGANWETYWELYSGGGADGVGTADFSGPASSVTSNFVGFYDTTGKVGKDSGYGPTSFAALVHASRHKTGGADPITIAELAAVTADYDFGSYEFRALKFYSDVATGTAPFTVLSTTKVANLNVAALNGYADTDFVKLAGLAAAWDAGSWQIRAETFQSDIATGTAPLTVASSTKVTNLNSDTLDGLHDTAFLKQSEATAENDFFVASGAGTFAKKTLAETKTILGIVAHSELLRKATAVIGDGTNVITTGIKGGFEVPCTGQITAARVMSLDATSGAIAISIWQDQYADGVPTSGDSVDTFAIAASGKKSEETGLTIAVTAGDWITFNVDSVTSMKLIAIALTITPS